MNFQISVLLLCLPFCLTEFMELEGIEEDYPPRPYTFGYKVHDKYGDQWRSEESDGLGTVHGSYGFVDDGGMHRAVEYVADDGGFRVRVRTNEPGMNVPSPANVEIVHDAMPDYDADVFGMERVRVSSPSKKVLYKYQEFAEKSAPPIYVVDGHMQSPWFPMDTVTQV